MNSAFDKSIISVIIPVRNEAENILSMLYSIFEQDYGIENIEIIVVDGESTDNTVDIVRSYSEKIIVLSNPNRYMPAGFNIGLNESKGKIIIILGGHCKISKNYISLCVLTLEVGDYDCVGGIINNQTINSKEEAISIALSTNFGVGGVDFRKKTNEGKFVDTVAFGAYKRYLFYKIGGLDEELIKNQDDEFNFRLIQNGGKIWLDPSIKSVYYPRNSLKKLFKQYFQYGFYKVRVMQKRRGFASWRHLVPGAFVLSLFGSVLLLPVYHFPFYVIFGSYVIANFTATLYELLKSKKAQMHRLINSFALLPITFFTLHFSYGLGFLCGLGFFWNKCNDREVKDHHFDREQFIKNTKILPDS